jgi:hypothetical protein
MLLLHAHTLACGRPIPLSRLSEPRRKLNSVRCFFDRCARYRRGRAEGIHGCRTYPHSSWLCASFGCRTAHPGSCDVWRLSDFSLFIITSLLFVIAQVLRTCAIEGTTASIRAEVWWTGANSFYTNQEYSRITCLNLRANRRCRILAG